MKIEQWHIVLEAHRKMRELLDETLPPAGAESAAAVLVGAKTLEGLHQELLDALNGLQVALAQDLDTAEVSEALRPLVFLFDEQVLARLAEADEKDWPLLQHKLYGVDTGGDLFFSFADEKLARNDTPPIVFEMLVFCLSAGFEGRYQGNALKLRTYRDKLTARIALPAPVAEPPKPRHEPARLYQFPVRYYVWTALGVVGMQLLLLAISNRELIAGALRGVTR